MIIFHEGLPRSGKTWESIVVMGLGAINAGRHVVTNVKGVDAEKIAQVLNLEPDVVRGLLTLVPWDQSANMHEFAKTDCLVIFDEVQDFHPKGAKLNAQQTEFITQHGHLGIDIVLCGQARRNIHVFWHDRIERLMYFKKMSALGSDTRYQWTMQTAVGVGKFTQISKGIRKYDPAYYGCYASHAAATTNKGALQDDRVVIWKRPLFRFVLPAVAVVAVVAANFVWGLFNGGLAPAQATAATVTSSAPIAHVPAAVSVSSGVVSSIGQTAMPDQGTRTIMEPVRLAPDDYVSALASKYRPRLAGLIYNDKRFSGVIEWLDEGYKVRETTQLASLDDWGWKATRKETYILLTRGKETILVTPWPVQEWGRASVENKVT